MDKDCLGCRIVSGSGLIGAAAYIAHQSKKSVNKWGRLFMQISSFGFASVGAARLLNIYPFNVTHKNLQLEKKQEGS
ncbi:hypothetical protein DAPPUDRAFT_302732 [Daphnia pulex]|uniref:Distal membrane-arm assembly complex protein 1-like domain-containing protein n=1 Tax=Daphnia pulex TaxID=6669 RepID=E9HPJ5_DAPPU|nr:hypothetical protein DAPPUDRAFT_302732 [Daphnia pulex]|eukprot:EFX66343.1 hypothetical protein DAPPUDRAFT_302732 [Daphnia pulex]